MQPIGRTTGKNPKNRFQSTHTVIDPAVLQERVRTEYFSDATRSALVRNQSPDIPFEFGLNPYRGCEHGCIYCYARPTHEYLDLSSGLDFESKIIVKKELPELLANELRRKSWKPQVIALSGNTDCNQPSERRFRITRKCLEVLLEYRNPVSIITKNHLILQDLDILREMAAYNLVHVNLSITTLKQELSEKMEPRASAPNKRLACLRSLADAQIPVGIILAPLIPGLNHEEMDSILRLPIQYSQEPADPRFLSPPDPFRPKSPTPLRGVTWIESVQQPSPFTASSTRSAPSSESLSHPLTN